MKKLKLSIVAAAYNEGDNLKNFFNFWLDQNYENYEIVIVNDWSTDNTEEVIKQYENKYKSIRLINNDKNRWVWYTRYNWYLHAKGDVIKFSDTDIAPDHPHQKDLIKRLMEPFNNDPTCDTVYIEYYPYFDNTNFVRSLENFYYYSPTLKVPKNYKYLKEPVSHMPSIFRYKILDLSWVEKILNWEDRYIASVFFKQLRNVGICDWNMILDVNNLSMNELYKRYITYWKNSLWLYKVNKKIFYLHIIKPLSVFISFALFIAAFFTNYYFIAPFCLLYLLFLWITIYYTNLYKKESKKLLAKFIVFWPFYLLSRYIFLFLWLFKIKKAVK